MSMNAIPSKAVDAIIMELVEYAALLDDLTSRERADDLTLTSDGLCGLNRLAQHMRSLAVEALGSVPLS